VRKAVAARVLDVLGLPPEDVVLVPPGSLPKTSSGKLQRSVCRARYLEETLTPV
jgi:fatty-acyl-CoA synthase